MLHLHSFIRQKGALDLKVFHLFFLQPLRIFGVADPSIGSCPLFDLYSQCASYRMFDGMRDLWDVGENPTLVTLGSCGREQAAHGLTQLQEPILK